MTTVAASAATAVSTKPHGATSHTVGVEPVPADCEYCGLAVDVCPSPFDHARYAAGNESSWR